MLAVFLIVFAPNVLFPTPKTSPATIIASQVRYAPSDAWVSSLLWLKENTPEPYGNPDFYYQRHELPPPGENYQYPESVYGVTAWWDYGYLITRIGRRIPSTNPSQDPHAIANVANLFISQNETAANEIIEELCSSYVIIDYETTINQLLRIGTWLERERS